MDLLWHINFVEMLGDLTVATFLILLAASVVIVGCMVLLPLIDLAFEMKVGIGLTIRHPYRRERMRRKRDRLAFPYSQTL
jgi:hypothetical protein